MSMRWEEWEPLYRRIAADFGFSPAEDAAARDDLARLLAGRSSPAAALRRRFAGTEAVVVGAGTPVDPAGLPPGSPVVVADKAVASFASKGGSPDLLVSDLDGDLDAILALNRRGVPVAVHAHGDNREALLRWVPLLEGPVLGTTQVEPVDPLLNAGGFTDGDRAAFLAAAFGARAVALAGFDFERASSERKRRKLRWARDLLDRLGLPVRIL